MDDQDIEELEPDTDVDGYQEYEEARQQSWRENEQAAQLEQIAER